MVRDEKVGWLTVGYSRILGSVLMVLETCQSGGRCRVVVASKDGKYAQKGDQERSDISAVLISNTKSHKNINTNAIIIQWLKPAMQYNPSPNRTAICPILAVMKASTDSPPALITANEKSIP